MKFMVLDVPFRIQFLRKFVVIEVWNCGSDCSKYIDFLFN